MPATSLIVKSFPNAQAANEAGYNYAKQGGFVGLEIVEAVIVQDGTVEGHPTVDFILVDKGGNKFVAMITGRLIAALPCGERITGH